MTATRMHVLLPVWRKPLLLSLLLHGVVLLLLLGIFQQEKHRFVMPAVMEAVVVAAPVPQAAAKAPAIPKPVIPAAVPEVQPRAEKTDVKKAMPEPAVKPLPPAPLAKAADVTLNKPRLPAPKAVTSLPVPQPALSLPDNDLSARRREAERLANLARLKVNEPSPELRQQEAANIAAASAERAQKLVAKHMQLIRARILGRWHPPLSVQKGILAEVRVSTMPGGEVTRVQLMRSSGNAAFDRSVEQAIWSASPLPVPEDMTVFAQDFRQFRIGFRPEDMGP